MAIDRMKAKTEIAKSLQDQSALVFEFRLRHFAQLSEQERLQLKDASRKLNARADEVLEDALEEGTDRAEQLIDKLNSHTAALQESSEKLARVSAVLDIAAKVSKAVAGVVSSGISSAVGLL